MGKDAGGTMTRMSDRRAKAEIIEIGRHLLGFGVYRFIYTGIHAGSYGTGRQVDVTADEVARWCPEAVSYRADGFFLVDYGRLFH